MYSTVINKA